MHTFNNKSSLMKLAGFVSPDTNGDQDSTNFESNYNNPKINSFNRVVYTGDKAKNKAADTLQAQGIPMVAPVKKLLGMGDDDNSQLSVVDTAEMMHKIHPKSYPTIEHARRFRDEYINPGRAQNPNAYLQPVPKSVALYQDPESIAGPAAIAGPSYTYSPDSTAFINVPSPDLDRDRLIKAIKAQSKSQTGNQDKIRLNQIARDQGMLSRGLDKDAIKQMLFSDTESIPHELHHVGNAVNTESLDKSNNRFFLPNWNLTAYENAQNVRSDSKTSMMYSILPDIVLKATGRPASSYNSRFYDTYLSIPNEHTQTLAQLRHYGKNYDIDTFTRDPNAIRQKYVDSFSHLVSNPDPSLNAEDRRLQNYADSLLYRAAMRNYLNTPNTAQRPTMIPRQHYVLKDPQELYRQQTIDFNRKNPEQVQQEAQRFLEPWSNNTLLYTY